MGIYGPARFIADNLQADTTNTTPAHIVQTGWGVITPGASATASETITFPVAFSAAPVVTAVYGGDATTATTYGSGAVTITAAAFCTTHTITASAFTIRLRTFDGNPWAAGNTTFYQWIAIGPA